MKRAGSISSLDSEFVHINSEEKSLQILVKQLLRTQVFCGSYQEKRYVEFLNTYRDVIVISKTEQCFIQNLENVRKRLDDFYNNDLWVGITLPNYVGTPSGYCIWVELDSKLTLGEYWFCVKKVKFRHNEILLIVKPLRPKMLSDERKSILQINIQNKEFNARDAMFQFFDAVTFYCRNIQRNIKNFTKIFYDTVLTRENFIETIKALIVLACALVTGFLHVVKYTGDFTIKFLRELSYLIRALTPVILECLNIVQKTIGGVLLILYTILRDSKEPAPRDNYRIESNFKRALPPPQRRY